jgi:outer membrane protein OmpA-like peptidoglycan-associated protein
MQKTKDLALLVAIFLVVATWVSLRAQDPSGRMREVPYGSKSEVEGVIVERSGDSLTVRDYLGGETRVTLTPSTEIKERKRNPFRRSNRYSPDQLLLGLNVEAKGIGDREGALVAEEIKFTQDDLKVAETITSRVAPVETELDKTRLSLESTQTRLEDTERQLEETTQRVDGQLEELDAAYRTARSEAQSAQSSADQALEGVESANRRISSLDDYDVVTTATVQFTFDSSSMPEEAKPEVDDLAQQFTNKKGYLIEVVGYSSSDGDPEYNRRLSQKRADAVVRYLTEAHSVPLRRIITPYGFGEMSPIADNSTLQGRKQNRRVEVRILVSRGLGQSDQLSVEDIR